MINTKTEIKKDAVLNHPAMCYFKPITAHNGQIIMTAFNANGDVIAENLTAETIEDAKKLARANGLIPMTLH